MKDEMMRGRSQIIWRYAPGATFRYNETGGWCVTTGVTLRTASPLTGALAQAVTQALRRWKAIEGDGRGGFPDPRIAPNKYAVGEPYQVTYSLWPTVFTCRRCGRVHYYSDIQKLRQVNDRLACMSCGKGAPTPAMARDQLRQVPYAYVCECGRTDSVYIPKHDNNHVIVLENKGSFQESYWYCKTCRRPLYRTAREGLGFRSCQCAPKKGKRGILLEDSRFFYSQTIGLVDVEPKALASWQGNDRFSDLLLGAVLRVPSYAQSHLQDLAKWKPTGPELSPELKAMRELLLAQGMDEKQVDTMLSESAKLAGADPWVAYERDLTLVRGLAGTGILSESRQAIEYVFVRDEPSATAIPLERVIAEAEEAGDVGSAQRLEGERALARQLGLINLQVVQALPLLLAGIGYTRYFAGPRDADDDGAAAVTLRPYPLQDGKIPIYVARNTTEALMYELDPRRLAAFLSLNTGAKVPDEARGSLPALRAWLLGRSSRLIEAGESHLILRPFEVEDGLTVDLNSALAFGLLHTVSHVLKATAHRYVGIDGDSLAEYLFPAFGSGLLYASTHVEFTLGGVDAVFRSNLTQWLGSARDFADQCSFDPVCAQSGGACLACLYPKFGCAHFNRTVSRSFLFGGRVPGYDGELVGFWSPEVTAAAKLLEEGDGNGIQ